MGEKASQVQERVCRCLTGEPAHPGRTVPEEAGALASHDSPRTSNQRSRPERGSAPHRAPGHPRRGAVRRPVGARPRSRLRVAHFPRHRGERHRRVRVARRAGNGGRRGARPSPGSGPPRDRVRLRGVLDAGPRPHDPRHDRAATQHVGGPPRGPRARRVRLLPRCGPPRWRTAVRRDHSCSADRGRRSDPRPCHLLHRDRDRPHVLVRDDARPRRGADPDGPPRCGRLHPLVDRRRSLASLAPRS